MRKLRHSDEVCQGFALHKMPISQNLPFTQTSTGLYRSCAALASFSGTFDLILFQAVNFELIVEKVWFGLVWIDGLNKQKITGFWFALIEFGLVWFGLLIPQTHKQINNY